MTTIIKPIAKGIITELLPNLMFRIQLEDGNLIIGYLSGKMRVNNIKVIIGDKVLVELDPYKGKTSNRIIRRL
jgi:translation initiation factor IF-1